MATPLKGAVQRFIFFGLISWVFPVSAAFGAQPTCPFSAADGVLDWFTAAVAGLCPTPTPIPVAEPLAANTAVAIQSVATVVTSFSVDFSIAAIRAAVEEIKQAPSAASITVTKPTGYDTMVSARALPDAAAD
jgi:hypothetical protein